MKLLCILRHAQSAGKQSGQSDYDRTLTAEGEENARLLGKKFVERGIFPDFVLSSSSIRTKQTFACLDESLHLPTLATSFKKDLYECSSGTWMDEVKSFPPHINSALLIGHNPTLSSLATLLGGESVDLAPCEMIVLKLPLDSWEQLSPTRDIPPPVHVEKIHT